jgi:hypothetical protein
MRWTALVVSAITVGVAMPVSAQDGPEITGPRKLMPRAEEIVLAKSAAPADVSGAATVLVLEANGYVVAEKGSNGVTCYVSRSQPESLEPHCFDEEGSQTILAMELRRAELRQKNVPAEDIDREIAKGISDGTFRLPRRPAMSYMLSSAQVLYSAEGRRVGNWKPHLMIYFPYLSSSQLGLGPEPATTAAFVAGAGSATSSIVVVVNAFVDPVRVVR